MPRASLAEYLIHSGDVLELTVAGAPELQKRSLVGIDGFTSFPLLGRVHVEGESVADALSAIRQTLPNKQFQRIAPDGHEYPVIVSGDEIDLAIAEYRPVYVNGDVSRPGEVPFRPGLTVRKAIALSGGFDIMRLRMNNPFLEQADLRADYETQWVEFAKEKAHIARVQAELSGAPKLGANNFGTIPLRQTTLRRIMDNEIALFDVHSVDYTNQKQYLSELIDQASHRIAVLTDQHASEQAGTKVDSEDLGRLQDALKRGMVPITRVVEAKRMLLFSSTRVLQTAAELTRAVRDQDDSKRALQRLDTDRRSQLTSELLAAQVNLSEIQARLQSLGSKLVYTDMVRSQLTNDTDGKPRLTIVRKIGMAIRKLDADEDTNLVPGDVIEVKLATEVAPRALTQAQH
jgi:polysaccharide export outer membrane protein